MKTNAADDAARDGAKVKLPAVMSVDEQRDGLGVWSAGELSSRHRQLGPWIGVGCCRGCRHSGSLGGAPCSYSGARADCFALLPCRAPSVDRDCTYSMKPWRSPLTTSGAWNWLVIQCPVPWTLRLTGCTAGGQRAQYHRQAHISCLIELMPGPSTGCNDLGRL